MPSAPLAIFSTLVPIFGVILLGAGFRRLGFLGEGFWPGAERLTYYALFPALLLHRTATASLESLAVGPLAGAVAGAIGTMALLLLVARPVVAPGPAAFTSVFQGSIRFNTYVGLSAALALFGQAGLNMGSLVVAGMIPLVNVLSVAVLVRFAGETGQGWRAMSTAIVRNPLVLACAGGIFLNASGLGLAPLLGDFLGIVGRAALPIGLLAVGAGIRLRETHGGAPYLLGACLLKLLLMPALMLAACTLGHVEGLPRMVAVLFAALPGSPQAFILARQLGGDAAIMANIVALQVVVSFFTLPLVIGWVSSG